MCSQIQPLGPCQHLAFLLPISVWPRLIILGSLFIPAEGDWISRLWDAILVSEWNSVDGPQRGVTPCGTGCREAWRHVLLFDRGNLNNSRVEKRWLKNCNLCVKGEILHSFIAALLVSRSLCWFIRLSWHPPPPYLSPWKSANTQL